MADMDALEARVRRLEDQHAVWGLMMDYRRELDRRDFAAYSRLFTDDGEWLGNLGHARGPAEIEQLLIRTLTAWTGDENAHLHLMANPEIEVYGDRATSRSVWVYLTRDGLGNPVLSLIGRYEDEIVRAGDTWKFKRRIAYCDYPYSKLDL
jgi:ketosteroid isomerase-like protein